MAAQSKFPHRRLKDLFIDSDVLTLVQFASVHHCSSRSTAEEKLMFAVLADAVDCFQRNLFATRHRCRTQFEQVEAWILSRDTRWIFSFENVCEVLHLSPSCVRAGLMRWRAAQADGTHRKKRLREFYRSHKRLGQSRIAI